jgi:hypothetical protein
MDRFFKVLCTLTLLSVVVACGGKSSLTDAQKAQLKELSSSASAVTSKAKPQAGTSALATGSATTPEAELASRMGSCSFDSPSSASPDAAGMLAMNVKVGGASCPVSMEFSMTGNMSGSSGSATIKMFFEVTDADLAAKLDVTKMDLGGTISGSGDSGSGTIKGVIQSKKYGPVDLTWDISGSNGNVKFDITYGFKDFSATFGVEQSESGTKYTLQGKEVTAAELKEYLEGGSLIPGGPTAVESAPSENNSSNSNLSYELTYNGCKTGKHSFSSEEALCEGLQSESLNNGCAENMRKQYFTSHSCSGVYQSQP